MSALLETTTILLSFPCHILFTPHFVLLPLKSFDRLRLWDEMQVDMTDGLPRIFTVLQEDLVRCLVDLLQLLAYFLSDHKQVDAFDLSQFLDLGYLSPRTDQHVSLHIGLMIDYGECVLADEEDLRRRNVC